MKLRQIAEADGGVLTYEVRDQSFRSDKTIKFEIERLVAPSYEEPAALIKREFEHCDTVYLARNENLILYGCLGNNKGRERTNSDCISWAQRYKRGHQEYRHCQTALFQFHFRWRRVGETKRLQVITLGNNSNAISIPCSSDFICRSATRC